MGLSCGNNCSPSLTWHAAFHRPAVTDGKDRLQHFVLHLLTKRIVIVYQYLLPTPSLYSLSRLVLSHLMGLERGSEGVRGNRAGRALPLLWMRHRPGLAAPRNGGDLPRQCGPVHRHSSAGGKRQPKQSPVTAHVRAASRGEQWVYGLWLIVIWSLFNVITSCHSWVC